MLHRYAFDAVQGYSLTGRCSSYYVIMSLIMTWICFLCLALMPLLDRDKYLYCPAVEYWTNRRNCFQNFLFVVYNIDVN